MRERLELELELEIEIEIASENISRGTGAQTFMTTCRPFSARMRGANSEPRYASRLYRPCDAKRAAAGAWPIERMCMW